MGESVSGGWVRFENTMPESLKVAPVSDKAFRLWVHAICYCSRAQTNGRVPAAVITNLSVTATTRTVVELLDACLVERLDEKTYLIHDYLDYNPSRERIEEMREGTRDRVARHREKRDSNGVTGNGETALQHRYSHGRDRSDTGTTPLPSSKHDESRAARPPSKRAKQDALPLSLPGELHHSAHLCLTILQGVQAERGGDEPTIRGVGLSVLRFPNRDHVRVARELEHWALAGTGQAKPVKDWSRTFGTFLERSPAGKPVQTSDVVVFGRPSAGDLIRKLRDAEEAS